MSTKRLKYGAMAKIIPTMFVTIRVLVLSLGFINLLHSVAGAETRIRVGNFLNITHTQAEVGRANGYFAKAMGPEVKIEWKLFNARL